MLDPDDFPALYTRPSSSTLLTTVEKLRLDLPSFQGPISGAASSKHHIDLNDRDVSQYLTAIVSSSLAWLPDDDARDVVWTAASQRLSERSGRSARPTQTRTLTIPSSTNTPLHIHLHEPTLTADRLGHKTWAAGYLLAARLPLFAGPVPALHPGGRPLVLELGAGTGLVGLALAHHVPSGELHLTDLPDIVPNLAGNVELNFPLGRDAPDARRIHAFPIDWRAVPPSASTTFTCTRTGEVVTGVCPGAYDLVIAADVLYGPEHPPLVARAAACFLKKGPEARVVVEVPIRERDVGLVASLKGEMEEWQLRLVDEGHEEGWEEMGREEGRVTCWWGVWAWDEHGRE